MDIKLDGDTITVSRPNDLKKMKSLHGLTRTLIHNMVVGVTEGYKKELEVNGVGYRAQKQGNKLVLALGYSHPVEMVDPDGIETSVDGNKIIVSGISRKRLVSTLLRSERREHQSHTRARVSSMWMRLSDVKLVRLVRNNKGVR